MLYKLPKISTLNNSKKITFKSLVFGEIIIDKTEQKIINNNEDVTNKCKDKFCDTNVKYNLATVCCKILCNEADEFCRRFLLKFDKVILK